MRNITPVRLSIFIVFCMVFSVCAFAGGNEKGKQSNKKKKVELNSNQDKSVKIVKEAIIYPNPTKGKLNVVFTKSPGTSPSFTVFNILGNDLKNIEVTQVSDTHYEINLSDKDAGLYFIRIHTAAFTITERITLDFTRNYTIS